MENVFRVMILIALCLVLSACVNTNSDGNQSDNNIENQTPDVEIEKETDSDEQKENVAVEETKSDENEEQEPSESESPEGAEKSEVVMQNEAFQVYEPAPNAEVKDQIVVRGLARVFEGTFKYEFEDGHFILDEGFTTASMGAPEWGEFEITINLNAATEGHYRIVLYEESAKDGSNLNELIIPLQVSK